MAQLLQNLHSSEQVGRHSQAWTRRTFRRTCQPNGKGCVVSGQNFPGEITWYANQECVQGLAKQGYHKMRGDLFWKGFEIEKHIKGPILEKVELCGTSTHVFCSEASFLFSIYIQETWHYNLFSLEPLNVLRSSPGPRSGTEFCGLPFPPLEVPPSAVSSPPGLSLPHLLTLVGPFPTVPIKFYCPFISSPGTSNPQ